MMDLDPRKRDDALQAVESFARQLLATRAQRRVLGQFWTRPGGEHLAAGGAFGGFEKENVAPAHPPTVHGWVDETPRKCPRPAHLEAARPLRELNGVVDRGAAPWSMCSLDSDGPLKQKATVVASRDSGRYLSLKEELQKEEELLHELRQAEQLQPNPSSAAAKITRAQQAEASLRRISQDLGQELEQQRSRQQQLENEMKNVETQCSRLTGRLQLQRQMASELRLRSPEAKKGPSDGYVAPVEADVIQLLHAAMKCLDGSIALPDDLLQSCHMARGVVDSFQRDLRMLLADLSAQMGEGAGGSCRSMVFSICDALERRTDHTPALRTKAPPAPIKVKMRSESQRKVAEMAAKTSVAGACRPAATHSGPAAFRCASQPAEAPRPSANGGAEKVTSLTGVCRPTEVAGRSSDGRSSGRPDGPSEVLLVQPSPGVGEHGALHSTQRLMSLLKQQEEEICECLSKLKPLQPHVSAGAVLRNSPPMVKQSQSPDKVLNVYPESLASTPYTEQKTGGSPAAQSPGMQQMASNAQRLQRLLELRGAAGPAGPAGPSAHNSLEVLGSVRTEDVPLRALWKEFQACTEPKQAQPAPAHPREPRLPCMVHLEEQEKQLLQVKQLLQMPKAETSAIAGVQQGSNVPGVSEGSPGTPPMLGTPSKVRKASTCPSQSEDAGTPGSCLRRARSRLSQLREGLNT